MSEQETLARADGSGLDDGEVVDAPVARPHRDRPFTGDESVDAALEAFDESACADLGQQLRAAEAAHRALQERLGR